MRAAELRDKTMAELELELLELRREQFNLRMQQGGGQAPRPHDYSNVRKNIARVKTVITEKRRKQTDD